MDKITYLGNTIAATLLAGAVFLTGIYVGQEHQKTLDVKVMEEFKIPRPIREEPRTGNKYFDMALELREDAKQFAFDQSCAAYANETLESAQKKVLGGQ